MHGSRSQLYLTYIELYCSYDVIDDVVKGEGGVQNCTASYWSDLLGQMNHMTIVY